MRKPIFVYTLAAAASMVLPGCGIVPPQVKYSEYSERGDFGYPFRQKRSVLLIKYNAANNAFEVHPAPTEMQSRDKWTSLLQIAGVEDWAASTQVKVTYINDTRFVDVVNVTTKDKVADTIKNVGDIVAAIAPVVGSVVAASTPAEMKDFKDTTFDPESQNGNDWQQDELNPKYCIRIVERSTEQGISLSAYLSTRKAKAADFPVPSCATGVLEIASCGSTSAVDITTSKRMRVLYSAKDQVTPIPLPSSGMLKMSAICGASVTEADNQDRRQLTNYVTSLIESVKKVEAAKKK